MSSARDEPRAAPRARRARRCDRAQHLPGQALHLVGRRVLPLDGREHAHDRLHRQGHPRLRWEDRRREGDDDPAGRRRDLGLPRDHLRDPHRDGRLGALGGDDRVHLHGAALAAGAPVRDGPVRGRLRRRARDPALRRGGGVLLAAPAAPGLRRRARRADRGLDLVHRDRDDDRRPAADLAGEGHAARLRRAGALARRLGRLLPGLGAAAVDAVALGHLAGHLCAARLPRGDHRWGPPQRPHDRALGPARDRRRLGAARALDLSHRGALREEAREAEAVGMSERDWFAGKVAERYDAHLGERGDLAVIAETVDFLAALAGDGAALELGIGTGRIALPLAQRGVPVHGIDLSQDMVAHLRAKPGGAEIGVTMGDFATTTVDGTFSLAYLVFNTIMNLTTQDEQVACFQNVASHLQPGGCFVIEVGVPGLQRLPPGETFQPFHVGPTRLGFDEYDVAAQGLISHHYLLDGDTTEVVSMPFRYVWPAELDLMARIAGMTLRERWSGWQREPFTSESRKHVSVWQKGT